MSPLRYSGLQVFGWRTKLPDEGMAEQFDLRPELHPCQGWYAQGPVLHIEPAAHQHREERRTWLKP